MLLADPPALGTEEQPLSGPVPATPEGAPNAAPGAVPANGAVSANGALPAADAAALAVPSSERACAHCGSPLHPSQAWCLHCGAPLVSALSPRSPRWPLRALAAAAAALAAVAAVAGAAVLTRHHSARRLPSLALVQPAVPGGVTPAPAGAVPPSHGGSPGSSATPSSKKALLFPPSSAAKPPKIPAVVPTPKSSGGSRASEAGGLGEIGGGSEEGSGESGGSSKKQGSESNGSAKEGASKEGSKKSGEGSKESGSGGSSKEGSKESGASESGGSSKESGSASPTPIVLDTNAASTYNPSNYPASTFGDPALAIDGEPSTAWTAAVQPVSFPKMAEGLLIDLRAPTALGGVELVVPAASIGMTVEIYGAASAKKPPATITARGWTKLSKAHVLRKKTTLLRLRARGKKFLWFTIWIPKASPASQGTLAAPGHVGLSGVSLFLR
jgi:hypothetical protein